MRLFFTVMLQVCLRCGGSGAFRVVDVGDVAFDDVEESILSSLLLLKTNASASCHVGIGGIFLVLV